VTHSFLLRAALVLVALLLSSPALPLAQGGDAYLLWFPKKPWALRLDLPGFTLDEQWTRPDGSRRIIRASNRTTDVIVSAFLEPNPKLSSTEQCRDLYWAKAARSPLVLSGVTRRTHGAMAIVRGLLTSVEGRPVRQENVHAYQFHDGVCIEVHLSKVLYETADERLFTSVLDTVRIVAR
jgi:hypothetical protein